MKKQFQWDFWYNADAFALTFDIGTSHGLPWLVIRVGRYTFSVGWAWVLK